MADEQRRKRDAKSMKLIERDVVQVEFLIDDLIKQLQLDKISPVANCNGCNACSAAIDLLAPRGE